MVKISKQTVAKKVHDFFQKIDGKKAIINDQVIHRILSFSDKRAKVQFSKTCKKVQKLFQQNFVDTEPISRCEISDGIEFSICKKNVEQGMVLSYLPVGCAGFDIDPEMIGHYHVVKVSLKGVSLYRLTNGNKATVGKRKFFIPYVWDEWTDACVKCFEPINETFYENLSDSWSIIAESKEEYLPLFHEHWDRRMPAWKIKSRGYPTLKM